MPAPLSPLPVIGVDRAWDGIGHLHSGIMRPVGGGRWKLTDLNRSITTPHLVRAYVSPIQSKLRTCKSLFNWSCGCWLGAHFFVSLRHEPEYAGRGRCSPLSASSCSRFEATSANVDCCSHLVCLCDFGGMPWSIRFERLQLMLSDPIQSIDGLWSQSIQGRAGRDGCCLARAAVGRRCG